GMARMLMARRLAGGRIYLVLERVPGFIVMERYVSSSVLVAPSVGLMETEPNETTASDHITGPGILRGQLTTTADVDEFALSLLPGLAQFEVNLENNIYDGGVFLVEIRNATDDLLASREVGSDASPVTINVGIAS